MINIHVYTEYCVTLSDVFQLYHVRYKIINISLYKKCDVPYSVVQCLFQMN